MIDEYKKLLDKLCEEFGTQNEVVIRVSQHLDKYILEEQKNKLNSIK